VNKEPYSVSIVLDRSYGSLMRALIDAGPVWVVDSPGNREFTQQLWAESPTHGHLDGVTLFKASEDRPPEQMLIDWMDTIDLHHGVYSADPPYTVIRVVGSKLTAEGRQVLGTFGFDSFTVTDDGFHAVRPLATALEVDEPAGKN
jgi:hypothetical protein